jgi:hypothetical protein
MDLKWIDFTGAHGALYSQARYVQRLMIGD